MKLWLTDAPSFFSFDRYVYLVDDKCRIRWAACGDAKDEETQGLVGCVRALLARADRDRDKADAKQGADSGAQSS
jgi:mitochondrial ATPase complex subunit ATP10